MFRPGPGRAVGAAVVAVLAAAGPWIPSGVHSPGGSGGRGSVVSAADDTVHGRASSGPLVPRVTVAETRPAGSGTQQCADPGQMRDHGGPVQTNPSVYVDFWGWTVDPVGERPYLIRFLSSIGHSVWLSTVAQYCASDDPRLAGQWDDTGDAPAQPTDQDIEREGRVAARHFGVNSPSAARDQNIQIIVALPPRASLPSPHSGDCAYHEQLTGVPAATSPSAVLTALPYLPDRQFGTQCGAFSVNGEPSGALDGVSIAEGHELAESLTDPGGHAWHDDTHPAHEIADACATQADYDIHAGANTFAVQQLWSNATGGCVVAAAVPGPPTGVRAAGVDGHIDVSWSPPADDGGTPITSWTVTATPGPVTCTESSPGTCVLSGLRNGTPYVIGVRASNAVGLGRASVGTTAVPSNTENCSFAGPYADLQGCVFSGARVSGPHLSGLELRRADLRGADLSGADLSGADLSGTDLSGADLSGSHLDGATLIGADLFASNLSASTLTGADLDQCDLTGADLSGVDASGVDLKAVSSSGITGTPRALPSHWSLIDGYLIGPGADLDQAELSFADLSYTDLHGADLAYADLISANVSHADLAHADLFGADVSDADLKGADVSDADLATVKPFELLCPDGTYGTDPGGACQSGG